MKLYETWLGPAVRCKILFIIDDGLFPLNPQTSERQALFLAALRRHNANMADAVNAQGCDRHLLGLQAIAMEDGLPMPALYTDPAYTKR